MAFVTTDVGSVLVLMELGLGVVILALVGIFLLLCRVLDELREMNAALHRSENPFYRSENTNGE